MGAGTRDGVAILDGAGQLVIAHLDVGLARSAGLAAHVDRRRGVVAKLGDTVYDGSLRTQLRTLRDELTK